MGARFRTHLRKVRERGGIPNGWWVLVAVDGPHEDMEPGESSPAGQEREREEEREREREGNAVWEQREGRRGTTASGGRDPRERELQLPYSLRGSANVIALHQFSGLRQALHNEHTPTRHARPFCAKPSTSSCFLLIFFSFFLSSVYRFFLICIPYYFHHGTLSMTGETLVLNWRYHNNIKVGTFFW